jgi:dihydroorotate dehydrogenase/NAD-dependent dihydropyrimidine dehydrogenase PreA subunit
MSRLELEVCGVKLKNPIVVASATPTKNAEFFRRAFESGAAAAVAKTVIPDEMGGDPVRTYVRPRFTILNKKGYPHSFTHYSSEFACEYRPDAWMQELREAKKHADANDARLIGSMGAISLENWRDLARAHEDAGCDMLEAWMFACPNLGGSSISNEGNLSLAFDQWVDMIGTAVHAVRIPIYVKVGSEFGIHSILGGAEAAKKAGAAGVTVGDRTSALEVDLKTGRPLLAGGFSGCGGPWMRPIVQKFVARVAREVDLPIAFTGGIWTWDDVVKAIMVGSTTVQVCTAIMYSKKGYGIVRDLLSGLDKYLAKNRYASVNDLRGITLPQLRTFPTLERIPKGEIYVDVLSELCDGCGYCSNWCFYDAISFGSDRIAIVDKTKCDGCGLCLALCPQNAFEMQGDVPVYMGLES